MHGKVYLVVQEDSPLILCKERFRKEFIDTNSKRS